MFKQTLVRTFLYKACPRCHGDLVMEPDAEDSLATDGRVEYVCLQCGRPTALMASTVAKAPAATSRAA